MTFARQDLTGQRFGRLVVERMEWLRKGTLAHCLCDCGVFKAIGAQNLKTGHTTSCGCWKQERDAHHAEARRIDLTSQRFGRLVVESMEWGQGYGRAHCRCDCGNVKTVNARALRVGLTQSCGCWQKEQASKANRQDLTGQRFGKLIVELMQWANGKGYAHCRCDCGATKVARSPGLLRGHTQSCGCLRGAPGSKSLRKDLAGQRFGRLLVQEMHWGMDTATRACCLCDCGKTSEVRAGQLTSGKTQSCGCWHKEQRGKSSRQDLTGQRFGRLLVESMVWRNGRGYASCRCDCGATPAVLGKVLLRGDTQSCGCLRTEVLGQLYRKNQVGQRFGRLVIQEMEWKDGKGYAHCCCDCGNVKTIRVNGLRRGTTQSCGCFQKERQEQRAKALWIDLTGQRFGSLVVEGMERHRGRWYARCRDDRGETKLVVSSTLRATEEQRALQRLAVLRRRALKRHLPADFERHHELFMRGFWGDGCAICGATEDFWHLIACDHWIPLTDSSCPGTVPGNMLPLCHARKGAGTLMGPPACNNSKGKQEPVAWLIKRLGARKGKTKLREIEHYFAAATTLTTLEISA